MTTLHIKTARKYILETKESARCPDDSRYKLQAHHIKKWSTASTLRYEVDNGITLCRSCHDSINGLESHYEALFNEIVQSKNG